MVTDGYKASSTKLSPKNVDRDTLNLMIQHMHDVVEDKVELTVKESDELWGSLESVLDELLEYPDYKNNN